MNTRNVASTVGGVVAVAALTMSVLIIQILLTDPVKVADAAGGRSLAPLFQALVGAVVQALAALVRYL